MEQFKKFNVDEWRDESVDADNGTIQYLCEHNGDNPTSDVAIGLDGKDLEFYSLSNSAPIYESFDVFTGTHLWYSDTDYDDKGDECFPYSTKSINLINYRSD